MGDETDDILKSFQLTATQKKKYDVIKERFENYFVVKVTVDLRGVFWGKQYSALCFNGKCINLYIIGELI